jgi:hypothetical protein
MLGLKINFEKSEFMIIMEDDNKAHCYSELFHCQEGVWHSSLCRRPTVSEMSFLGKNQKKGVWLDGK